MADRILHKSLLLPAAIPQKVNRLSPGFGTMPSRIEDFTKQAIDMALFIISNEEPIHVRSMGQIFVIFWFSPLSVIPPILHTHSVIHMVPTIILAIYTITNPSMPAFMHHRSWMH